MQRYILQRFVQIPILLFIISLIVFALIRVTPGDPVRIMMGNDSNPELERAIRKELRLDLPIHAQYGEWMLGLLRGDFGKSIRTREPVVRLIADRLPVTLSLAIVAMALAVAMAVPIGLAAASHRNSPLDYSLMLLTTLAWSVPNFVVAILLILVVAVNLRWLPISGTGNLFSDPLGSWRYFLMPTLALGLSRAAVMARMLRSSMLDELRREYVRTAVAKGVARGPVLWRHVLRNSLMPVVTVAAINFGYLLGGAVVIEQIFGLAGTGTLLVQAVFARDFPVIQAVTLLAAVAFVSVNLLADIIYGVLDPRIRYA